MNNTIDYHTVAGIVLAAGKGKRMNAQNKNKVTLLLSDKPLVLHIVHFMQSLHFGAIVVVVGHEKESVQRALMGSEAQFAEQVEQLGTGDALKAGAAALPAFIKHVCVVYGDDAVLYSEQQRHIIERLFQKHIQTHAKLTFLTIIQENPFGLGRIVRNENGDVLAIVEEKDATETQKQIQEINPGCFVFDVSFLKTYLPFIQKSPITGEYYINSLIDLALEHHEKMETLQGGRLMWRGVNTPEELYEAEKLYKE